MAISPLPPTKKSTSADLPHVILANDYGYIEGGASRIAFDQLSALHRSGFDSSLLIGTPLEQGAQWRNAQGWECVPTSSTGQSDLASDRAAAMGRGIFNTKTESALQRLLEDRTGSETVILVHSWSKILSPSLFYYAKKLRLPVILMLHDYMAFCPNGAYFNYQTQKNCQLRPLGAQCLTRHCDRSSWTEGAWRRVRGLVSIGLIGQHQAIKQYVCVSHFQAKVIQQLHQKPDQVTTLVNPVTPLQRITLQSDAIQGGEPQRDRFIFMGRLSPEKGAVIFARAARDAWVKATFIGCGKEEASVKAIYPAAEFTGWLDGEDMQKSLSGAIALVYPSLWRETFGLGVYEAASLGIPAIVPKGTAMLDFVKHHHNGLVFGSTDELRQQLTWARDNPEYMVTLGRQALADYQAVENHSGTYADQLANIILGVARGTFSS